MEDKMKEVTFLGYQEKPDGTSCLLVNEINTHSTVVFSEKKHYFKSNQPQRGDENFEAMRNDKTKIPLPTKREYQIAKFNVAIKMMQCFRYQPWMSDPDVTNENGERINLQGEIFIPKFRRRN